VKLQELMQAYRDGDSVAFTEFYARVAPRIRAYLRSLIRDSTTADDLLQQTFAKLHAARHGYVQGADPVPWLYAIARRACIDELRRRRRAHVRLGRPGEVLPDVEAGLSGTAVGAEENEAFGAEDRERVLEASLTRRSRGRLPKARAALMEANRKAMAGLTDAEQGLLRQLLNRFT